MTKTSYTLAYPVTIGGVEVASVPLHRPKARAMRIFDAVAEGDEIGYSHAMIAACTGLTIEQVEEIDMQVDFPNLAEIAANFFDKTAQPPTTAADGAASSPTAPQS